MQNSNQNRHVDKSSHKVIEGYKSNLVTQLVQEKKIVAQKKYFNKLDKLFRHLSYQELDAD